MSEDPVRLLDEAELPPQLRGDLSALRDAPPPTLDYEAGLAALGAAIRGPGGGAPPDASPGSGGAPPSGGALLGASARALLVAGALAALVLGALGAALLFAGSPPLEQIADTSVVPALPPAPASSGEAELEPSSVPTASARERAPEPEPALAPTAERTRGALETDGDSLRREMVLVEQMRRALESDPARALELSRQAEREIGRGTFGGERDAIRALSLFALGRHARARALAAQVLEREPDGLYAARIRRAMDEHRP